MSTVNTQFAVSVHIMSALAYCDSEEITSQRLAESLNTDPSFVRRSLAKLSKAGLVTTTRGRHGFCTLARSPKEINLLAIYHACEAPPAAVLHAYPEQTKCPISCHFKECMEAIMDEAQRSFEATLAKTTIADLVTRIKKKCKR